jgi:hypothetical protein
MRTRMVHTGRAVSRGRRLAARFCRSSGAGALLFSVSPLMLPLTLARFGIAVQRQPMRRLGGSAPSLLRSLLSQAVEPAASLAGALRVAACSGRQSRPRVGPLTRRLYRQVSTLCSRSTMPPNPSLERTSTGKALGPRNALVYAASRGPSAMPAAAAQLKR